jgi:hypothetical protein
MTTPNVPFWTNTNLNLTKPDLNITFNSYDLKYDVYTKDSTDNPVTSLQQNEIQNIQTMPLAPCKSYGNKCGWQHFSRGYAPCDPKGGNENCSYDNPSCPDNYIYLGQRKEGNCSNACGGTCQNEQLTFCGGPNFKCSITNGYNECSGYM